MGTQEDGKYEEAERILSMKKAGSTVDFLGRIIVTRCRFSERRTTGLT